VSITIPQAARSPLPPLPLAARRRGDVARARRGVVAVKNVTVNEDFFQGHFPGAPLMPGVLMIESLAQAAALLLVAEGPRGSAPSCAGVDNAKFRRRWCRATASASR
jgi:3-hydroxymyristoyl/3-hydroxydecanoyl-(acyl carrier protein) dehydratase